MAEGDEESGRNKAESFLRKHWVWIVGGGGILVVGYLLLNRGSSGTTTSTTAPTVSGLAAAPPTVNVTVPTTGSPVPTTTKKLPTGTTVTSTTHGKPPVDVGINQQYSKEKKFTVGSGKNALTLWNAGNSGAFVSKSNNLYVSAGKNGKYIQDAQGRAIQISTLSTAQQKEARASGKTFNFKSKI